MSKLLPCPFCGCTDIMEGVYFFRGELKKRGAVRCADCGVRAPTDSWNKRIPSVAQATLTWEPEAKPDANCPYDHTAAATPFGTYQITWKSWKDYPSYYVDFEGRFVTTDNDLSDAKDAALVDFNKRLRACGEKK